MGDGVQEVLARLEERVSGALKRIDEGAKRDELLYEINTKIDVLTASVEGRLSRLENDDEQLAARITQHGKEIDELRQKPAKRWESLVGYLISATVGAIIVFIAARLGMK